MASCAASVSSSRSLGCCSAALLTSRSRRPNECASRRKKSRRRRRPRARPRAGPLLDQRAGRARVLVLVEIENCDVGGLLGEADRDRAADPAVAAGDQRDLARELAGATILAHLGARLRGHLRAQTRLAVLLLGGMMLRLAGRHQFATFSRDLRTRPTRNASCAIDNAAAPGRFIAPSASRPAAADAGPTSSSRAPPRRAAHRLGRGRAARAPGLPRRRAACSVRAGLNAGPQPSAALRRLLSEPAPWEG